MERALWIPGLTSTLLYAAAFAAYLLLLLLRDGRAVRLMARPLLVLALAAHGAYEGLRAMVYGHHPMASLFEILSIVALALALVYLVIEIWRGNKATGVFVLPFVVALQGAALLGMEPTWDIPEILRDPLFGVHTGFAALGYAAFFLAAIYAVMLLLFDRAMRRRRFGLLFERLTSLDVLARMNRGAVLVGLPIFAAGAALGLVWADREGIPDFILDPKVLLTMLVVAVFGLVLAGAYGFRWSAGRVAKLSLAGFALMLLATAAVQAMLPTWHRFGG
jgi:ABC-type uncharacterized transport system permease subunit